MHRNHYQKVFIPGLTILMVSLLFIFMILSVPVPASAQGPYFSEEYQLLNYLDDHPSQASFNCSKEFYTKLQENEFFELYHALVKAGIDYSQVMISYNDFLHHIEVSNIAYTNTPWAECSDMESVRQAVRDLASNRDGFILLCPWLLADNLLEGSALHRALIRSGIESYHTSYAQDAGIIRVTDIHHLPVPYAVIQDYAQFASAIAGFEQMGISDFYTVFDPDLFQRITDEPQQYTIMIGTSRLGNYRSATDPVSCAIRFSEVEFTDAPREICRSIDDVPDAIRRMGTAGIRDFELIFPDTRIFEALAANDFDLLLNLEASAGMSDGRISYSSSSDRIIFTDAEITANAVMLQSLPEAIAYTESQVNSGARDIHLFCSAELFEALMGDLLEFAVIHNGMNRIYDLIAHAGIFNYDLSSVRASHVINIHINQLFPGTAVMQAVRSGDSSSLTPRELQVWSAASEIAKASLSPDPLQTARTIHDWLCSHVVYVDDDFTDEDDNAIGAILNGQANCDGYSDAFYLIGSLAGLNIRYQHGDIYDKNPYQQSKASTHLWNLLEMDGQWRMVDVTNDDVPYSQSYRWFNAGSAAAREMFYWNEDMTVPIALY